MISRRQAIRSGLQAAAGVTVAHWVHPRLSADQPAGPGPRAGHAMAYHAGLRAICLVSGDRDGTDVTREEPWLWDGRSWTTRAGGQAPGSTTLRGAASDPERKSILIFGGLTILGPRKYGPPSSELWELDAKGAWRRRTPSGPEPGPRHHHAVAFDSRRGRLVVYGGIDDKENWPQDVWEWDRERWHHLQPDVNPGERAHHAMAYDSTRGVIVLRGGTRRERGNYPTDTWEWDGRAWRMAAADGPGPGNGYRMAYDAERRVTVLFGGETCVWDGKSWTRLTPPASPPDRAVHGLAYDPSRQRVVLYGGSRENGRLNDLWEWDGRNWTARTAEPTG